MSLYPIIKLPRKMKQAYAAEPQVPVFTTPPTLEAPKIQPPQRLNVQFLAIEAALLALALGFIGTYGHWAISLILGLIGLSLIWGQGNLMRKSYPQRWREYREQLERYQRQRWELEFEIARHQRLQTPDGIEQYRRRRIAELLATSAEASGSLEPLSAPEKQLSIALAKYFPTQVQTGVGSGLMLIDQDSNFHISVIVDLKLQSMAGVAAGSFIEDDLYLDRGWAVARFTPDQAIDHTDSCCKALAEILAEVLQNQAWVQPFSAVPDLWSLPTTKTTTPVA